MSGILLLLLVMHTCERFEPEPMLLVLTDTLTDYSVEGSTAKGIIIYEGKKEIEQHGFCWSESPEPTVSLGTKVQLGARNERGSFQWILTGLEHNTTYFVRAYATDGDGTIYGKDKSFATHTITAPEVHTIDIQDTTQESARSGGEISSDGGSAIVEKGVCWGISPLPTLQDKFTREGSGDSSYTSELSGLKCATSYYVRAYATNRITTGYGEQLEFTTLGCPRELPDVNTLAVTQVTDSTARGGGEVIQEGTSEVVVRGICWSTKPDPDLSDFYTENGKGDGVYASEMDGLICETLYYVRAYATNSSGTGFGDLDSFQTTNCPINPLEVNTGSISDITQTSVHVEGEVLSDGGETVSAKGICWSTDPDPDLADAYTNEGGGLGPFGSTISGLDCETLYYVRAYATNSEATEYGQSINFTTLACTKFPPEVSTSQVTEITQTTARVSGIVTGDGGAAVTSRGVCWSTSLDPVIENDHKEEGSGTGGFDVVIDGLEPGTDYYARAYATNMAGTEYGENVFFTTVEEPQNTVTDKNGNIYQTVHIGNQTWMAENLRATKYADGTPIQNITSDLEWANLDVSLKAYCWYNNSSSLGEIYGAIYTWSAVMNGAPSSASNPSGVQGVCPDGWHVPSDSEWKELEMSLGMSQESADSIIWRGTDEGGKLKATGFDYWSINNTGATNSSNFDARAGGVRDGDGFKYLGKHSFFWTSTEYNFSGSIWRRRLDDVEKRINRIYYDQHRGYYVRCLKD